MSRLKQSLLLTIVSFSIISCNTDSPLIDPPFQNITNQWHEAKYDVSNDYSVDFPNGTKINIPKNAFVDTDGKPVTGEVLFRFRELSSLDQILISGIPMTVGKQRDVMVSSDMFELRAYQGSKPLELADNKTINTVLASNDENPNFDLYRLDEKVKNWDLKASVQPELNQTKTDLQSKLKKNDVQVKNLNMENLFVLNYLPQIDLGLEPLPKDKTFNYHNYDNDPSFEVLEKLIQAKLMKYGAKWIYGYDNKSVKFNGTYYHSSMVVWQANKAIPEWITKKRNQYVRWNTLDAKVTKLKSGNYRISIIERTWNKGQWNESTVFQTKAKIKMPLKELYQSEPTFWSEEITRLENEAKSLKEQFETQNLFLRTFDVNSMGIYNYDRIKENNRIMVSVELEVDGNSFSWNENQQLFAIPAGDKTVIRYHKSDRNKFILYPDQEMLVFMVKDGHQIYQLPHNYLKRLDLENLSAQNDPVIKLPMNSLDLTINNPEDVILFLNQSYKDNGLLTLN